MSQGSLARRSLSRDHRVRVLAAYLTRTYGMDRKEAIMMLLEAGPEEQMKFFACLSYIYKYGTGR